jgi:hypothetical protein
MDDEQIQPWYRQIWPWMIMVPPAVSVVAGLTTFYLAGEEPAMVVDDYGRIAMAISLNAERTERAEQLGLSAQLTFATAADQSMGVAAVLQQHSSFSVWPDSLRLHLAHPTLAERDQTIPLAGSQQGYSGTLILPIGRYYVSLSDAEQTWRLSGEMQGDSLVVDLYAGAPAR